MPRDKWLYEFEEVAEQAELKRSTAKAVLRRVFETVENWVADLVK